MNAQSICCSIFTTINNLLLSGTWRETYRIGKAFSRKRKLNFEQLFYFLLDLSKMALPLKIADFRDDFSDLDFPDISKQAVSKARQKIHFEAFKKLLEISSLKYYESPPHINTWQGYRILAIDGTSLQLPQTDRNRSEFGGSSNQTGSSMAMASASLLFDVLNDIIIDALIGSFTHGEREYAFEHLDAFLNFPLSGKYIIVLDRGYPSYEMIRKLYQKGFFFVIRQKKSCRAVKMVSSNDEVIHYGPDASKGPTLQVRVLQLPLDSGETEILLTNLLDPAITLGMFKELYFLRWPIEGKYRELKERFELEEFSGSSPISIRQDFYIHLFYMNITAIIKSEADKTVINETLEQKKGFHYQCNRSFIIGRLKKHLIKMLAGIEDTKARLEEIVQQARKVRSQVKANRTYKRTKKLTRRKHHNNRKRCL